MRRFLVFALSIVAAPGFSQDFGPISTRNHRAIDLPFLRFDPTAGVVPRGHEEWNFSFTSANDSRWLPRTFSPVIVEDEETERVLVRYRKGMPHNSEWMVDVPLLSRGGGFMDPFIDFWHQRVLRWEDTVRRIQPFGQSTVQIPGSSFGSATGIGDVSAVFSRQLTPRIEASLGAKAPTGNAGGLLGSGGADLGGAVQWHGRVRGRLHAHAMLGLVAQGKGTAMQSVRGLVHQEGLALTYERSTRDNWVLQWQGEASAVNTGIAGSDATQRVITFGYQRRLGRGRMLELSFTEDGDIFNKRWPEGANVGPDFTARVGYVIRK